MYIPRSQNERVWTNTVWTFSCRCHLLWFRLCCCCSGTWAWRWLAEGSVSLLDELSLVTHLSEWNKCRRLYLPSFSLFLLRWFPFRFVSCKHTVNRFWSQSEAKTRPSLSQFRPQDDPNSGSSVSGEHREMTNVLCHLYKRQMYFFTRATSGALVGPGKKLFALLNILNAYVWALLYSEVRVIVKLLERVSQVWTSPCLLFAVMSPAIIENTWETFTVIQRHFLIHPTGDTVTVVVIRCYATKIRLVFM